MTEVPPELKPCPFCEGEGCIALGKDGESKKVWFVYCPRCGAHGPAGADPDDAAAVWNRRSKVVNPRDRIIDEFREVLEHAEWDVKELDGLVDQYSKRTVAEAIGGARAGIEDLERSLAEFDAAFKDDPNAWYDATSSMTYELMNSIRRECEHIDAEKKERKRMAKKKALGRV